MNELDPNFHYSWIGLRRVFSENQVISKKKGLRRNPKAFSGRNQKFKRFFRPKTDDLQKNKVFAEIRRLFPAEIRNLNGFSGQKQ